MTADPSSLARGVVHVWHASAVDRWTSDDDRARALAWLSPAERTRFDRYRRDLDRDMFLLGRVMARALVGRALGVAPTGWAWVEGPRGRPDIAGDRGTPPVSFNLAHSGGLVVCAIARGVTVGVDIEDRRRASIGRDLAARACTAAELAVIEAAGEDGWRDCFLRHWTLKEAYLKGRGLGIAQHLTDTGFTFDAAGAAPRLVLHRALAGDDARWAFALRELAPAHYVAIAAAHGAEAPPAFTLQPLPRDLVP
jgi:4'-phosphopantetheinyl transferase